MNIIKTEKEVEAFLRHFKPKLSVWGITFLNRSKNIETQKKLGINETFQIEIIKALEISDYIHTIIGDLYLGDLWVFGKSHDNVDLYIKISLGPPNSNTICISFHIAEFPLEYPFK